MAAFIFMLTRDDRTVPDCLARFEEVRDLGLRDVGFKDVGVDRATLRRLTTAIHASGARAWLEVVDTTPDAGARGAEAARALGVDVLMGGTDVEGALAVLAGSGIDYLPFPGRPQGHPTRLAGSVAEVVTDCLRYEALGAAGVDLLAWRAEHADPVALVAAARSATRGRLVVAGSIDSPARIAEATTAGADAFTMGSALLDGRWGPGLAGLAERVTDVLTVARDLAHCLGAGTAAPAPTAVGFSTPSGTRCAPSP